MLSGRSRCAVVDESFTDSRCRGVGAEPDASLEHLSPYLYDSLYRCTQGRNKFGGELFLVPWNKGSGIEEILCSLGLRISSVFNNPSQLSIRPRGVPA